MNLNKFSTILITVCITLIAVYTLIWIYNRKSASETYNCEIQLIEAQKALHSFKLMTYDIPNDLFNDIIQEAYYWDNINHYFEQYDDPYDK